jgi:predicted peptidase
MLKVFKQSKNGLIPFVYEYLLSRPSDYDANDKNKKWPLILFLHGVGECDPPIEKLLKYGPPKLVHDYSTSKQGKQDTNTINDTNLETAKFLAENFVTCSPQVNGGDDWNTKVLSNLIDQIEQNYNINQNKIYCTGLSMGKFNYTFFCFYKRQTMQKQYFISKVSMFFFRLLHYALELRSKVNQYEFYTN